MGQSEKTEEEKEQEQFDEKDAQENVSVQDGTDETQEQSKIEDDRSDMQEQETQDKENQDLFAGFVDVIKSKFEDHNINIIMGDYVRQNNGVVAGEKARFRNTDFTGRGRKEKSDLKKSGKKRREFLFDDENKICKWMKENFGNHNFLWMITLAVFHDMPYSWIKANARLLKRREVFETQSENNSDEIIPKDELLKNIGAFTYMDSIILNGGEVEAEFVGFVDENAAETILKIVWMQFTDYRDGLLDWVKLFAYQGEWIQSSAAIQAISFTAKLDYFYFETHMLQRLVSDDNIVALSKIMYLIAQNEKYTDYINKIAKHWGTLGKCSYLLTALSVAQKNHWSVQEIEPIMSKYIDGTINAVRKSWLEDYLQNFPIMFVLGENRSSYYKAMISAVYKQLHMETKGRGNIQRQNAEQIFLMMVETDYEYTRVVRDNEREMLLINMLFIKNQYAQMLADLWIQLWKRHSIHAQVKNMIITYWKQKCDRDFGYERQMGQFLRKIAVSEREIQVIYKKVLGGKIYGYSS